MNLTLQDCIDWCGLTAEEVAAIAEHEHIPEIVAAELAEYLCQCEDGELQISRMIVDDIERARQHGRSDDVQRLKGVLKHFIATHPDLRRYYASRIE